MKHMSVLVRSLAGLLLLGMAVLAPAQAGGKTGLVIQISDNTPALWALALNNAKNVQAEMGKDNIEIEIVAYGPGINMLKVDSEVGGRLDEAMKSGVTLTACQNTMKAQKLAAKDIYPGVGYVPSGVVEIIKKQNEGWAYLKL